jgi:hypothetical protein
MKLFAIVFAVVLLSGCVGDQRNRQTNTQHIPPVGFLKHADEIQTASREVVPAKSEVSASNNANEQSQTGIVNAAVGKVTENLKLDLAAVKQETRDLVNGVRADVKSEIEAQFKLSANANVKASAEFEARISNAVTLAVNQKIEAALKVNAENQQAWNQSISKMQQEMKAGRDNFNHTIQFTSGMQALLEKSYESQIDTVKEFCWMFVALISAGLAYLKLRENNDTKKEMKRDQLEHEEDMALISKKKTSVMQRGLHSE